MALALWSFCPNVLGNGSLIMPDLPATALGAAACYTLWRWLKTPTWLWAMSAGAVLGLAELTKTTVLILYALWPVLWFVYRLPDWHKCSGRRWLREGSMLFAALVLALYLINLGYGFEGSLEPLGNYQFQSDTMTGFAAGKDERVPGNRFSNSWFGPLLVPLPKNYVQGIDTQKLDFECGTWSYLRGQWSKDGWWYYYLYALAIKVPVGTWLLALLAIGLTAFPAGRTAAWRDEMLVLGPLVTVIAFVSSNPRINTHFRYALPSLPFLFIWSSKAALTFEQVSSPGRLTSRVTCRRFVVPAITAAGLGWSIGSSLWYYPHSLSYFNELAGGPKAGHNHLLGSGISWGQDLLYLKDWYDAHPEARPFHLAIEGVVDSRIARIESRLPPGGPKSPDSALSLDHLTLGPLPGWYAIDVHFLHNVPVDPLDRAAGDDLLNLNYFTRFDPIARVGHSICVFRISIEDANRVRAQLHLKELTPQSLCGTHCN